MQLFPKINSNDHRLYNIHFMSSSTSSNHPFIIPVKVIQVIDGNTCVLAYIDVKECIRSVLCKLYGVVVPDISSTSNALAKKARNYLINLTTDIEEIDINDMRSSKELQGEVDLNTKIIWAVFHSQHDSGYFLVTLYFREEEAIHRYMSMNQMMLNSRLGKPL